MNWQEQTEELLKRAQGEITPDSAVFQRIALRVVAHQRTHARVLLVAWSVVFLGSAALLAYFVAETVSEISSSGLWDLVRLIGTDASAVSNNLSSFLFSIVEMLPVISFTGILLGLFGLFISGGYSFQTWYENRGRRAA